MWLIHLILANIISCAEISTYICSEKNYSKTLIKDHLSNLTEEVFLIARFIIL